MNILMGWIVSEFLSSKDIDNAFIKNAEGKMDLNDVDEFIGNLLITCKRLREALCEHHKNKKWCRRCFVDVTGEREI